MRSILASIKPEYCELIASGAKTLEMRKTSPKGGVPFKVFIYETKGIFQPRLIDSRFKCQGSGKVIGEFICDAVDMYQAEFTDLSCYDATAEGVCQNTISKIVGYDAEDDELIRTYVTGNEEENPDDCQLLKDSCLTFNELRAYVGETFYDKTFYAWHISDLVIYTQPKDLKDFICPQSCPYGVDGCETCAKHLCLTRPPQSWCYCEDNSQI